MKKSIILLAAIAVVASACGSSSTTSTTFAPPTTQGAQGEQPADLDGSWTLVSVALPTQQISVAAEFGALIELNNGDMTGNGGCNSLSGVYTASAGTITFGNITMTEIGCAEGMELESAFFGLLAKVDTYAIVDGILILRLGTEELAFRRT